MAEFAWLYFRAFLRIIPAWVVSVLTSVASEAESSRPGVGALSDVLLYLHLSFPGQQLQVKSAGPGTPSVACPEAERSRLWALRIRSQLAVRCQALEIGFDLTLSLAAGLLKFLQTNVGP